MSSISVPSLSRLPVIAASLVAMFITSSAFAQGERIAAECIQQMHETATNTGQAIQAVTHRGIHLIHAIDDNGGSDDQIIAAARHTQGAIDTRTQAGEDRINATARRCLQALSDIGADASLARRVNRARRMLLASIGEANHAASSRVAAALRRALNN